MADEIDGKIQDRLTPDPDMERAEPLLAERAPDATPWAESGAFGTDVGAPPPPPTETDIMRTFAKPSARAIEALRLNPQYADDFDMKYGGGAAVQNLFDAKPPAGTQIDPHVARPTVTWSTRDLLEASKERPAIWGLVDGFLNEDALRQGALRDRAAFGSLQAFRRGPAATTEPAWLEQEIAVGEARVDDFRRREQEALASGRGLTPLEETAKRVAEHRLEAAQAARADIDDKIIRQAESQVQLVIAERLAEQKQRVAYAQDQLEQFDRDPTVGEQTGRGRDFFADALRSERKKLQLLDDAFEYARQRVSVPDATGRGEVARSFLRAVIADTPEMLAGAMARLGKDSENGAAARDLAEEMRRTVRGWRQDTAAPARGEFLALDPKSPTFANDLKLWSAHALGQGLGTSAATIVAAMAAGPFGAFGTGMAMGVGQMENALEDAFAKEGLRFAEHDRPELVYGLGAAIGALDSFALLFNLGQVGGPVKNAAVRNIASAIARGAAKGAAMEGVTEAMQESLQMLGEAYALEKGIDWKEYARRSVEAFAAGAVPGSVFGARQGRRDNDIARGRQMVEEIRRLVEAESRVEPVAPVPAEPDKAEPATEKPVPVVELPDPVPVSAAAVEKARDKGALAPEDMRDLAEIGRRVEIADPTLPDADIIARMTEQRQRGATFTPDFDAKLDAIIATVDPVPVEDRPVAAPDPEAEAKAAAAQEVVAERRLGETLTQIADQAETIRRLQVQIGSAPDGMNTAPLQDALQQAAATQRTLNRQKNDLEKTVAEFVADRAKRPPRTLAEGLQRVGIAAWLDRGASLDMADRSAVAESLGVDPDQVVPLLETEVLAGRLRKDSRGRYRRMPGAEPTSGDAAVSTGARAQIQALIEAELDAGRPVQIPPAITLRILNGMTPSAGLLPPGYRMAAPARFEPVPDSGTVAVEMMTADGASVVFRVDRDLLLGSRALTLSRFGLVASTRLFLGDGDGPLKTLGGEVRHEIVHAQWGRVPGPVKQRLVGHANALGVLDRTVGDVLDAVGEDGGGDTRTLRQAYSIIYADRSNLQDVLDQEAVAHMVELGYHDALDVEQLAPVADDMAVVFGGAFAQQDARLAAMPMAALDADVGRSMRRDLDALGYYSKALEVARGLKQAKGTPEQMLAQLKKAGVKDAEIEATRLAEVFAGANKNSITRAEIVKHLEENRVGLREVVGQPWKIPNRIGDKDAYIKKMEAAGIPDAKWSRHSLDPSNPTYRETVLHLPVANDAPKFDATKAEIKRNRQSVTQGTYEIYYDGKKLAGPYGDDGTPAQNYMRPDADIIETARRIWERGDVLPDGRVRVPNQQGTFQSGHFPEPNIIGHMMTSMTRHEGKPVYTIDQIQSDWGQKLRDGGVRDEAKITDLAKRKDQAEDAVVVAIKGAGLSVRELGSDRVKWPVAVREAQERMELLSAELRTAEASASGNPLVNTTDQWVNTTLRRAIRQAVEADADAIAIPSGKTVLSYNPGDEAGMEGFYNQIVPKNLRNLLQRLDKSAPDGEKVAKLGTPTKGEAGEGFTVFRLTPAVKRSVIEEGQPMFALGGRPLPDGHSRVAWGGLGQPPKPLYELIADLNTALGLTTRLGHLNPGLKAAAGARGGKLHGQHSRNTDVVRLAFANDLDVLAHEGGHALETRFGNDLRVIMDAHRAELEPLGTPGRDSLSEGFAEFFRRYVVNPSTAETKAPKFFKAFENFLDAREPPMLAAVQNVSDDYQSWIDAPSGGAVASHIVSTRNDGLVAEMTKHVRRNGFQNVSSQFFHGAYTMLVDRLHPISQAVSRLIDIAQINIAAPLRGHIAVTAANDPYKLLRLARNGYQTGHLDLMRGVRPYHGAGHEGPSMHEAIGRALGGFASEQWTDDRLQAFGAYLAARRMVAEWDRFKSGELDRPPDLLSRADHAQAVGDYEAANPTFAAAADMVHAYLRNMLAKARDAGFVSRETFDELSRRKDYVPVNRNREDDAGLDPQGQAAATRGGNKASLLKGFRGSTRDIINPLESIARASYEWNFVIARNEAIRALDRLARAVGPGGGAIAERLPAHAMTGTPVNAVDVVKQAGRQAGVAEEDMIFLVGALEEALGQDADTVLFRPGLISENGEAIVWLWEDGKRVPIRLPDGRFGKWMYEAITDLGVETMPAVLEIMSKPSQWLRAGVTRDPGYMLANLARDNLSAWVLSNEHGSLLPNFAGSASAAAAAVGDAFGRRDESLDLLRSFGGITGGFGQEGMNAARIDRDIRGLRKKGIRLTSAVLPHRKEFWEITGASETGTRLAVFRKALERAAADGLNEYEALVEAAYTANDLLDFGRYGSRMLAARRLITFLNSQIQGMDKGVRTSIGFSETYTTLAQVASPFLRQGEGHVLTAAERQRVPVAAKAWAKMIIGFGLPAFLMSWMYRDDDEYQEIPEYFRTTHWVFRDPSGVWRRIPKPFELSAGSLVIERAFEAYYMRDGKAAERLGEGLKRLVMPTHTVPGVQVAYELWANKSGFTGAPIVPQHLSKLPGELQFTAYTSELAKWLAVMTGQSAAKIDHAIAGITGSLGRSALDASNRIMPPIGRGLESLGLPRMGISPTPRPELRQSETIFVRRFTVDPARSAQSKKDFWEKMSETTGSYAVKAQGYKEFYDRGQFSEASDVLARATPNERAFMLLEGHGAASEKRGHPLSRARQVLSVTNGVRRDLDTGKLKDDQGNEYSPSDRRVIQEMIEQVQMREARNAQVVLGEKGYENKKIMPVAPILAEIEAKIPSIAEEIEYRLRKAKVRDFDDVAADWPTLKADVLDPGYAPDNPPRRKVGRRAP